MIGAPRRRAAGGSREAGTTLTELNVTMIVLSVVLVTATSLIIGFQRTNAANISRQEQIDSARFAVETISKTVRTAAKPSQISAACAVACTEEAFLLGTGLTVRFYGNLNNPGGSVGPSRVEYAIATSGPTAGQLVETVQRPDRSTPGPHGFEYCDATSPGASSDCKARYSTRVLAEGVITGSGPVFRYFTRDGEVDPTDFGGVLSGTQMTKVVAVEIFLRVQAPNPTTADPNEYVQRVMLPNTQALIIQERRTP